MNNLFQSFGSKCDNCLYLLRLMHLKEEDILSDFEREDLPRLLNAISQKFDVTLIPIKNKKFDNE